MWCSQSETELINKVRVHCAEGKRSIRQQRWEVWFQQCNPQGPSEDAQIGQPLRREARGSPSFSFHEDKVSESCSANGALYEREPQGPLKPWNLLAGPWQTLILQQGTQVDWTVTEESNPFQMKSQPFFQQAARPESVAKGSPRISERWLEQALLYPRFCG